MFIFIRKLLKYLLWSVFFLAIFLFLFFAPTFGSKPSGESLEKIKLSQNFNGERFVNSLATVVSTPVANSSFSIMDFIKPPDGKNPVELLPAKLFDKKTFKNGDFVWFGHSTILVKTDGATVLADPVFYKASPVPFTVKPFAMQVRHTIEDLPEIDVVIISHDHYDHLDYQAIKELNSKVKHFLVPLGIKAHLLGWGVANDKITELDWYSEHAYESLKFTLTPARHFSGRGVTDRFSTLWGSWVVQSNSLNMYFSGDSGYFDEFKKIGDQFGPFDIAFIENGAYNANWSQIHMLPEESVQAAIDLGAKVFFPIHWGKFDLSVHAWKDPAIRAHTAAIANGLNIATPIAGEIFTATKYPSSEWWLDVN